MLSLGLSAKDIVEISFNLEPDNFINMNIVEIFDNLGLENGDKIVKLFRSMIKLKCHSADLTFKEHYELTGGKILTLTGTCLNDKKVYYFNKNRTPDMKIIDALRITISFPIFFTPVQYDGKLFIDGAFLAPNPAIYFSDEGGREKDGMGKIDWNRLVVLMSSGECTDVATEALLGDPTVYLTNILNTFKHSYLENHMGKVIKKGRAIIVNNNSFAMDFGLTRKAKFHLYLNGVKATVAHMFKTGRGGESGDGCEYERLCLFRAFEKLKRG